MFSFPALPPGDAVRVSASTYLAFRQCPAQAEGRLRGRFSPESRASFTGALAHRLFARHLRSGPIADVAQAVREEIGQGLNPKLAAIGIHRPSELTEIVRQVAALYDRFRLFPSEGFESAECELTAEPAPGVTLVGKVDAVFREGSPGPVLRDWKTGALGEPLEQLFFYALVWALAEGVMAQAVEAVSLQTGERLRSEPSPADLELVVDRIAGMVSVLRTAWSEGRPPDRRAGPWCAHCPLLEECPEGQMAAAVNR